MTLHAIAVSGFCFRKGNVLTVHPNDTSKVVYEVRLTLQKFQ